MQATCRRVEKIYSTGFAFAVVFDVEAVPVPGGVFVVPSILIVNVLVYLSAFYP